MIKGRGFKFPSMRFKRLKKSDFASVLSQLWFSFEARSNSWLLSQWEYWLRTSLDSKIWNSSNFRPKIRGLYLIEVKINKQVIIVWEWHTIKFKWIDKAKICWNFVLKISDLVHFYAENWELECQTSWVVFQNREKSPCSKVKMKGIK